MLRKLNSLDEFDPKALELMGSECFKSWLTSFHQEQDHFQSFALHSETQLMQMLDATKHVARVASVSGDGCDTACNKQLCKYWGLKPSFLYVFVRKQL